MEQNKKIKVLQVAGRMDIGGIENQLMHLIRNADRRKFQIDFTTTETHPYFEDEIVSLGGKCIHIPGTNGRHLIRYCKALYRVMRDGKYDIVHSHELFHSGLVVFTAKLAGVKHRFVHAHSSNQKSEKSLARLTYIAIMRRLILCFGTVFLACSSWAAEFLYGEKILKKPNYHLVVNSVETRRFLPTLESTEKKAAPDGWKTVLQVGRFCDEKNFVFTTQIAAECKHRGEKIRFWFVGNDGSDNPFEKEVKEIIAAEGLEEYVQLLGIRNDVNDLMKQADVFVLPSKYEGMPLTLIEAQAACLPCIAADSFSHEADFGAGLVQWMKPDAPVSAWADCIARTEITKTPALIKLVQDVVSERGFDVTSFSKRICSYYEESICGQH